VHSVSSVVNKTNSFLKAPRLFAILLAISASAWAESQRAEFVAGLRERGLYQLADEYGSEQWRRADLSDRERADLAIQLALVYTEHALASPPQARDALWSKASAICAALEDKWPANPRRPLVEVQRALVSLARGELAREESTAADALASDSAAIEHLRSATRGLDQISEKVAQQLIELRLGPPADASPDALTSRELESLEVNIAFQLARAQRQLGLCYPQRSADRDNALLQAVARLTPLAQRKEADELAWNARVELAACLRDLGRLQEAQKMLHIWTRESAPADIAARLSAEDIRVLIAAGELFRAQEKAQQALRKHSGEGELALAAVEAELALWHQSAQSSGRRDSSQFTAMITTVRERHGPYWGRRAQLLVGSVLASTNESGTEPQDAAALLIAAKHLYGTGRIEEAVANYDRAAQQLGKQGKLDETFTASMTAAAIERGARRFAAAAKRYRQLALKMPANARAAEAHQLAILCTAEQARDSPPADWPAIGADYEQLLQEHLVQWPDASSSDAVRFWSGKLLAARANWSAAIQILVQVRANTEHYAQSIELVCDCYERQLEQLEEQTGDETEQRQATLLAAATKHLQPVITGAENRWPARWTNLQHETAISLARLHLRFTIGPSPYAERLLRAVVEAPAPSDNDSPQEWQATAQPLLVVALARNGKVDEASASVAELADTPAASLVEMLKAVEAILTRAPHASDGQQELGRIMLVVLKHLDARSAEVDAGMQAAILEYHAIALAAAGDRPAAIALYAQLLAQSPNDGELQEHYARLLAASESAAELRQALSSWHVVEWRSRRGGPRWRRARQARIELLHRLGESEEADKLLRLTRLLYPDWDSSAAQ
jgi:tetratricopeptide (TPR) repeat protein